MKFEILNKIHFHVFLLSTSVFLTYLSMTAQISLHVWTDAIIYKLLFLTAQRLAMSGADALYRTRNIIKTINKKTNICCGEQLCIIYLLWSFYLLFCIVHWRILYIVLISNTKQNRNYVWWHYNFRYAFHRNNTNSYTVGT